MRLSSIQRLLNVLIADLAKRQPQGAPGYRRERLEAAGKGGELAVHHLEAFEGMQRRYKSRRGQR